MAFMVPEACYLSASEAREYTQHDGMSPEEIAEHDPGAGWYGRLSAPGYLDATDWDGPYTDAQEALAAVMALYDVDENGDPQGEQEA